MKPPEKTPSRASASRSVVLEQLVAPVDRSAQRPVALREVARPAREQAHPVGEPLEQLLGSERAHPCRRQLDGEREAVEGGAELGDGAVGCELGSDRRGPLGEERHGGLGAQAPEPELALAADAQRDPARGQDLQAGRGGEQPGHERGRAEHLLEVVQHEQGGAADEEALERGLERAGALLHADCVRDRRQRQGGLRDRGQLDEHDSVREVELRLGGDLEREPGLAGAAGPGHGHATHVLEAEQLAQLGDLGRAADDRRGRRGQHEPGPLERARRRELGGRALDHQLVERLRLGQVLQPVLAERAHAGMRHQRPGRLGEQDLAAVGSVGDPGRTVHVEADIALAGTPGDPAVDAHADAQLHAFGPGVLGDRPLGGGRRGDGARRSLEHDEEAVARRPDLAARLARKRIAEQLAMVGEDVVVALPEPVEETRRPLDVGEEKGRALRAPGL